MSAERFRYKAFISYSHRDTRIAQWLHGALESYRAPKHLMGRETPTGTIQKRLGTIFRDRDELPVAADLTGQINDALAATQFLIVLCSTASATSKWVNQEVINFKRLKGAASIIAVIVDGEPYASAKPGQDKDECFVPALRFQVTPDGVVTDQPAEPIAADLRPGKDGKRMVKLKVLAGLLGVGLDDLVQRENIRRQRFMTAVTFASLLGIGVMGALTFDAIQAREDAEVAQERAERQKSQAEGLIEFMLGDLRKKLEPVGRLDALDAVGGKALQYFKTLTPEELDADTLGRQARTLHLIGEIQNNTGSLDSAEASFSQANLTTNELLERDPTNTQRIFDHAQSVYWTGYTQFQKGDFLEAEGNFRKYLDLATRLTDQEPNNNKWRAEVGYALTNLGVSLFRQSKYDSAVDIFTKARDAKLANFSADSTTSEKLSFGQANAWIADSRLKLGQIDLAVESRTIELRTYQDLQSIEPKNKTVARSIMTATMALGNLALARGQNQEAVNHYSSATEIGRALYDLDPANKWWGRMLVRAMVGTIESLLNNDAFSTAEQKLDDLRTLTADISMSGADMLDWETLKVSSHLLQTRIDLRSKNLNRVKTSLAALEVRANALLNTYKQDQSIVPLAIQVYTTLGDGYALSGDKAAAKTRWIKAAQMATEHADRIPLEYAYIRVISYVRSGDTSTAITIAKAAYAMGARRKEITAVANEASN